MDILINITQFICLARPSCGLDPGSSVLKSSALPIELTIWDLCRSCDVNIINDMGLKFKRAAMQMIWWMCGVSMKDRRTSEKLRKLVGVKPITTVIRNGRLRWYRHVMRKSYPDWVKKCIELKAEDRLDDQEGHGRTWDR